MFVQLKFPPADNKETVEFKTNCLSLTAVTKDILVAVVSKECTVISKCQWFPTSPFLLSGMKSESTDWWVIRPTRAWKGFKNNRGHVIAKRALATQS